MLAIISRLYRHHQQSQSMRFCYIIIRYNAFKNYTYHVATPVKMFSLEKTIDEVFCKCVCFNRDETLMAVGCADNKIVIFDTATNEKRTDLDELGMVKSSPIKSLS